jgi:hypothetical protein
MSTSWEVGRSDPFVANDGGRWFVMQNIDTEDAEGYPGMRTEYLADANGYDTRIAAEQALSTVSN